MKRLHPLSFGLGIASGIVLLSIVGGVSHVFFPRHSGYVRGSGSGQFNPAGIQRVFRQGGGAGIGGGFGGGARNFQQGG